MDRSPDGPIARHISSFLSTHRPPFAVRLFEQILDHDQFPLAPPCVTDAAPSAELNLPSPGRLENEQKRTVVA